LMMAPMIKAWTLSASLMAYTGDQSILSRADSSCACLIALKLRLTVRIKVKVAHDDDGLGGGGGLLELADEGSDLSLLHDHARVLTICPLAVDPAHEETAWTDHPIKDDPDWLDGLLHDVKPQPGIGTYGQRGLDEEDYTLLGRGQREEGRVAIDCELKVGGEELCLGHRCHINAAAGL
jgi:hypothetical protein